VAVDQIKEKIKNKDYQLKDIPLLMKAIEEIANSNEELTNELKEQDDIVIQLDVKDVLSSYLEIKAGKLTAGEGMHEQPTVTIRLSEQVAQNLMSGELDTATAYTSGDIEITGEMAKALAIRSILEIVGENLGLDIGT